MELLKLSSGRGLHLGDAMYMIANIAFVAVLALLVFVWQLGILALILAILSKWRVLAVRPRYWGINLRSNLLDLIFIVSVTALIINPVASVWAKLAWMLLLTVWLLVIKTLSTRQMMILQAGMTQFVGLVALLTYAAFIPINQLHLLVAVIGAWLVGYATARHVVSSYESETKIEFFALLWAFIVAQLVWLFSHWLQVYSITPGFEIPQVALIILLLAFCVQRLYALQRKIQEADDPHMRRSGTRRALKSAYAATMFSGSLILIILLTTTWSISI